MDNFFIIILGPTGVGKSELAERIAQNISGEIVNGDNGQMYGPLSIGTAKPAWKAHPIPHHLFDVIDEPKQFSVAQYRKKLLEVMESIWSRKNIPVIVGGSSFYIYSIFFPPKETETRQEKVPEIALSNVKSSEELWEQLFSVDNSRALKIHKNDRYRIGRALQLWENLHCEPSLLKPVFLPPKNFLIISVARERAELYKRINDRVEEMFMQGWVAEVQNLNDKWKEFLFFKKLIGYSEILDYLKNNESLMLVKEQISRKTRNYAKSQISFWRKFKSDLLKELSVDDFNQKIEELNLTFLDVNLYIKQLSEKIEKIK